MHTVLFDTGVGARVTFRRKATARTTALLHRAVAAFREWRRCARSRAELVRLDDRALRDIGLTRAEVLREIDKPFWRK